MPRKWRSTRTFVVAAGAALWLAGGSEAGLARSREERDQAGRVVRRADGERVRYPQGAARSPATPAPLRTRPKIQAVEGPNALQVREEWRRNTFGWGIALGGLEVVDLDADGDQEVVASTSPPYWYVLEHEGGDFPQSWVSETYPDTIDSLRVAQVDTDAPLEVVVGAVGTIYVYDGATHQLQSSFDSPAESVIGLAVADVDGDTRLEAVFCDTPFGPGTLYVYDLGTGVQEYAGAGYGCRDLAVGNVDADPALEIVLARQDDPGLVLNGATHAVEWTNFFGFGDHVRIANLDGIGPAEVIASTYGSGIGLFDVTQQSLYASIPVDLAVDSLAVVDVEGDGPLEIVYGDDQWGDIHVHNGQTLVQKWQAQNPEHGVAHIAVGDADGDGHRDLLWGAGFSSSGPDHLYLFDTVTQVREWESLDYAGPFYALAHGDFDADGQPELLHGSTEFEAFSGGVLFIHHAVTHALELQQEDLEPLNRVANANVDGDPQHELFVATDQLTCVDALTLQTQWTRPFQNSNGLLSLQVGNVDADPQPEVVTVVDTFYPNDEQRIHVMNAATGADEWVSPSFGVGTVNLMRLANVDGDANVEIVVGIQGGALFMADGQTHTFNALGNHDVTALDTADRNGDGVAEIVVGTDDGVLEVVRPDGTVQETIGSYPDRIDAVQVVDVTGDGVADYVLAVENQVIVRDGASGLALWNSGMLNGSSWGAVGSNDSLKVADVDSDGRLEIFTSAGPYGIRVYEIPAAADLSLSVADAPDPALVGGSLTYTWSVENAAPIATSNVALAVNLPPGAAFVSSTPGAPACTPAAGVLSCGLGALAGSSSTSVTVVVTPQAPGTLVSSGTVSSSQPDPDPSNNGASASTTVTSTVEADLGLTKDDGRVLAGPGQTLTYDLTVTNVGPWPVSSLVLNDTLPPQLLNPVFTPSVGSYSPGTGAWTGVTLAAGQGAVLRLTATVSPSASGTLVNSATVAPPAGVNDLVPGNNTSVDANVIVSDRTELTHGTSLLTTPGAEGDRYFAIHQQPRASYEVVVDAVSGDLGAPVLLQRLASDLSVLATGAATGSGPSRTLRWENASSAAVTNQAIRVRSAGCTTDCGADDVFRIRAYDTTYDLARFNNGGGQASVVIIQNASSSPVNGTVRFWSGAGTLLASVPFASLPPRGVYALITPTVPSLAGAAGSITVTSDAPYGTLAGKVVSVEPATGFAFDTPMRARPR